jgi:TIR domain
MDEPADFFVSYTGADRAWAEWVSWQLEQADYSVIVQAWDFEPGDNFVVRMRDALEQADRTLALVSAAYLASPSSTDEWTGAFLHDPDGRNRLLQVRIEDCELPRLLRAQWEAPIPAKAVQHIPEPEWRVRLSGGQTVRSRLNRDVPPVGVHGGARIRG